ncbi:MAG: hypothetical protein R3286_09295 [Gammaproteobacteria bacterium]|nr:hypothetical protein [Gammaproteobacteria bacterium]
MLAGHYSASFALKAVDKSVPLWALFVAVQLMDVLWVTLILLGVEKVRVDPALASVPLDLYYMPWSHSLPAVVVVCAAVFALYRLLVPPRGVNRPALVVAAAVGSHWVLDVLVHRPDLPLYDDTLKIGLALWNHPGAAFALEVALLVGGLWLYLRATKPVSARGRYGFAVFTVALIAVQAALVFGPVPPWLTPPVVAVTLLVFYFLTAGVAAWLERGRV